VGVVSQSGADGWRLLRNSAQAEADGKTSATPDSRLGIQLNWNHGTDWEGALQVVALKRPSGADRSDSIQWAYLGYRPSNESRIRLGRTNPDMFLFSNSRSVGYGLLWARPPLDFYSFVPIDSVDGVNAEYRWGQDSVRWGASITAGSYSTSITDSYGQRYGADGKNTVFLSVSRDADGLLLKASYVHGRIQPRSRPELAQVKAGLQQLATLPLPGLAQSISNLQRNLWSGGEVSYLGLAAQYERGPWVFITEGSLVTAPGSPSDASRGYASLGYRLGQTTYYGLASRVVAKRAAAQVPDVLKPLTPVIGPTQAAGAQHLLNAVGAAVIRFRYDQSTIGAGLRWDLLPNAALKLQVDKFRVHPNGSAGWVGGDTRGTSGTLYSVVLDFVWGQ
jgi:hypothetical protein